MLFFALIATTCKMNVSRDSLRQLLNMLSIYLAMALLAPSIQKGVNHKCRYVAKLKGFVNRQRQRCLYLLLRLNQLQNRASVFHTSYCTGCLKKKR